MELTEGPLKAYTRFAASGGGGGGGGAAGGVVGGSGFGGGGADYLPLHQRSSGARAEKVAVPGASRGLRRGIDKGGKEARSWGQGGHGGCGRSCTTTASLTLGAHNGTPPATSLFLF